MSTFWRTPRQLFDPIDKKIGFKVDAAADSQNHLLPTWYGPGSAVSEDALEVKEWLSPAWCNPPYGKGLQDWVEKFIEQSKRGAEVVALLPAYTSELWFADLVRPNADILFCRGRVPFLNPCDHCGGTGRCEDTNSSSTECCKGGGCEVCDQSGIDPKPSRPRFGVVLACFSPDYRGRVDWIDWKHVK